MSRLVPDDTATEVSAAFAPQILGSLMSNYDVRETLERLHLADEEGADDGV